MHSLGEYAIEGEVARGGAGVVYRGRARGGQAVAIKVILSGGSAGNVQRFRREVAALSRLRHPGVVHLHDVGSTPEGHPYLVMDFVEGSTLGERFRRGLLPISLAVELTLAVAEALADAHALGIVHRDVKPDNVLLTADGRPRLTDFGLAMEQSGEHSLTTAGNMLGTPGFMPPEQVMGALEDLGPPADVYGLGATLYACLTGSPPFTGEPWEVLTATTEKQPSPPSSERSGVDAGLDAICLRCLRKDPAARYRDAGELAAALRRYLAGELPEPVARRGPLPGLLVAAVLALGAAGAVWASREVPTAPPAAVAPVEESELTPELFARMTDLGQRDQPEDVLATVLPLLERHPDHPLLLSHAGRAYMQLDELELGLPLLERSLKLAPDDATVWLHWAIAHMSTDAEVARAAVKRSLELEPSAGAYCLRAWVATQEGRLDEARADLARAETLEPNYLNLLPTWGVLYARAGDLEAAVEAFSRRIEISPAAGVYQLRAQILQAQQVPVEEVLADLDAALARRDNAEGRRLRAEVYARHERWEESAADCTRILELRPDHILAWRLRSRARMQSDDRTGALADARQAISLAPDDPENLYILALALHYLDQHAEALEILDGLLERYPQRWAAQRARARMRLFVDDYQGALADARPLLRETPNNVDLLGIAATASGYVADPQALELARRWTRLAPNDGSAQENRARVLWFNNEFEELLSWSGAELRGQAVTPAFGAYRGAALLALGKLEAARRTLQSVLDEDPSCAAGLMFCAELAQAEGQSAEALRYANRLLEVLPLSAEGYGIRARAHMELGDLAAARRDMGRFSELTGDDLRFAYQRRMLASLRQRLSELEGR